MADDVQGTAGDPYGIGYRTHFEYRLVGAQKSMRVDFAAGLPEAPPTEMPDPYLPSTGLDRRKGSQKWMDELLRYASRMRASDLHIDDRDLTIEVPGGADRHERTTVFRMRVDGKMRDLVRLSSPQGGTQVPDAIIASLGENRPNVVAPLEGTYDFRLDGEQRRCRVVAVQAEEPQGSFANVFVLRLPLVGKLKKLSELDFSPHNLDLLYDLIDGSSKLVLFIGPMGSGKTTTAHGVLNEVVGDRTSVVYSVEDPVERIIPGITQISLNERNHITFETIAPVLVRADYNVLFLGEIRDNLTAKMGVRQSKAGRQVISTMHADDNATAVLRLIDLSEDVRGSVLDSLGGLVSQRLVAKLNPHWDGVDPSKKYYDRVPVHEIMLITESLSELISDEGVSPHEVRRLAEKESGSSFRLDAQRLLRGGVTDADEILRVLQLRPEDVFDSPEEAAKYPLTRTRKRAGV